MEEKNDLSLNHIDLCTLFHSYSNRLNDYVQSNGGGQGVDMKVVDFFLENVDKFGSATAKAIRQMQVKPSIIMPNAPKSSNSNRKLT